MAQTDLYTLLGGYANRIKSPYVTIKDFLVFIGKYAERKPTEEAEWMQWAFNTEAKFKAEIQTLIDEGKCIILVDEDEVAESNEGRVFIPAYCRQQIDETYRDSDKLAGIPFPSEKTLRMEIPEEYARTVTLVTDMGLFFNKDENSPEPEEIIILNFPQNYGSALMLAQMIPGRLMEIALLKIRHYLHSRNNKDFILNKLIGQMQGKEKVLREIIDQIMLRPLDCLSEMERSADFPYLFWTYCCPLVKNDINKKNDFLADDLSAMQAIYIIEICCSFYRAQAAKKREIDAAFMTLEVQMDRPPLIYNLGEIIALTNDRGIPLLDIYSQKELDEYIQRAVGEMKEGVLPRWLMIQGEKGERCFVKKERYQQLANKMISETLKPLRAAISKRWTTLIRDYSKEAPMDSDADFEKLLVRQVRIINPVLQTILEDPKLFLSYKEMDTAENAAVQPSRIFRAGEMLPYSILFAIRRKELLSDIKYRLPFWFSIPFIVAIISFFRRLAKGRKKSGHAIADDEFIIVEQESVELSKSARLLESVIVPEGMTIDAYLDELEERYACLLNRRARQNLVTDVQSLLRDNLKNALKVYKLKRITREGLREMSSLLVTRSPALSALKDQEALRLYMELYMIKLLILKQK